MFIHAELHNYYSVFLHFHGKANSKPLFEAALRIVWIWCCFGFPAIAYRRLLISIAGWYSGWSKDP